MLKRYYYEPNSALYEHIQELEKLIEACWTQEQTPEAISRSFHLHWEQTGLGLSEHNLLVKTFDHGQPKEKWLDYVIYLDQLRSAENIGSILRTVEAFRLGKVAFTSNMANADHPKVKKTSMGTYQEIQVYKGSFDQLPRPWIAVETHSHSQTLNSFQFPPKATLFFGNEEYGLSTTLLEQMDAIIEVPLVGCKNSLNVATCLGIISWEIRRQIFM